MQPLINLNALILAAGSLALACSPAANGDLYGAGGSATAGSAGVGNSAGASNAGGAGAMGGAGVAGLGGTAGIGGDTGGGGGSLPVAGSGGQSGASVGGGGQGGAGVGGANPSMGGAGGSIAIGGSGGSNTGGTASDDDPQPSEGCGTAPTITTGNGKSINAGGKNRSYNIRLPDNYDMNKPHRLIVGYHGATLSADLVTNESYYGLARLSEDSTIFVAPQGLDTGGQFSPGWPNEGGEDVEFSRQLIAELESALCIDKSRIFAEGFSMGGSMAYAMACGAPDIIRAVAVHSGGPMSGCAEHDTPVAYFMTHGTQDDLCTYPEYGVPELQDFAQVNGCTNPNPASSASEFESGLPDPTSSNSACIDVEGCMDGYPVRSCLFVGPHQWNPGGGNTWVSAEVWSFFSQF